MTKQELINQIKTKQSFLCIGLDVDLDRIPKFLLDYEDPIFEFNKRIIDATHDLCVAYKPNTAFYEAHGSKGWDSLKKTEEYIPKGIYKIADAKRGDIGNTSKYYAKAFFEEMNFDAVTVAPYMGTDSVTPFLEFEGKWVILLALTSNKGSLDFQMIQDTDERHLYEAVLDKSKDWGSDDQMMYVVGATQSFTIGDVRKRVPNHFFLVPGVGAQGGSLMDVADYGWNNDCGVLVNSSRGIIYAGDGEDFAEAARTSAKILQSKMKLILDEKEFINA